MKLKTIILTLILSAASAAFAKEVRITDFYALVVAKYDGLLVTDTSKVDANHILLHRESNPDLTYELGAPELMLAGWKTGWNWCESQKATFKYSDDVIKRSENLSKNYRKILKDIGESEKDADVQTDMFTYAVMCWSDIHGLTPSNSQH
jgi:hypothetical protein